MDCICCGEHADLEPIDEGCSIRLPAAPHGDDHKRRLVRVATLDAAGVFQPTIHYDCIHNQIQAVRNRIIGVVVKPTHEGMALVRLAASDLCRSLHHTGEDDLYALANRHSGRKADRYRRAADQLSTFGLNRNDSCVKMFVKSERFDPTTKVNPDPRPIQFRAAKYCVALAQFLRPIEEQIYTTTCASDGVPPSRNVAKGLNSVARAELLVAKASHFNDPVFIPLDASRYDKHVSTQLLKVEHSIYLHCNGNLEFRNLLKEQLINRCFTNLGLSYVAVARRMSGDMNTASGNVILMLVLVIAVCRFILRLPRWDCLDDGDDVIAIVERCDVTAFVTNVVDAFASFGMKLKVEEPVSSIHEVEFCQARIVEYSPSRFKFVRDFRTVMSKATCGVRNWQDPAYRSRVIHAIGTCEMILGLGVPILQNYAQALLRNSKPGRDYLKYAPDGLRLRAQRDAKLLGIRDPRSLHPTPIQQCARASFAVAFGVTEHDQLRLERRLDEWTFDTSSLQYFGAEWDVASWTGTMSRGEVSRQ